MAITDEQIKPRVDPILMEAARLIREEGWIQYDSYVPGLGYCITGAISKAVRSKVGNSQDAYDLALRTRQKLGRSAQVASWIEQVRFPCLDQVTLVDWNDAEERTKEEVIKLLEDAAVGREVK